MGIYSNESDAARTIQNSLKEGMSGTDGNQRNGDNWFKGENKTMDDLVFAAWGQFGEKGTFTDVMQNVMRYQDSCPKGSLNGHFSLADGAWSDGKLTPDEIHYQSNKDAGMTFLKMPTKQELNESATLLEHMARRQNEENDLYHKVYRFFHRQ